MRTAVAHRELEVVWPLDRHHYLSACADPIAPATQRRRRRTQPDPDTVFEVIGSELVSFHQITQRLSAADDGDKVRFRGRSGSRRLTTSSGCRLSRRQGHSTL